jgi:hypothetical protein
MPIEHDDAHDEENEPMDETPMDDIPRKKANGHAHAAPPPEAPPRKAPVPRAPRTVQGPPAPQMLEPRETQAHLIWDEMLVKLTADGIHPSAVTVYVERSDPPPSMPLGSFGGESVPGGAQDFFAFLVNNFHARSQLKGPALYTCRFKWRGQNQHTRTGTLRLPPMEELSGMGPPRAYGAQAALGGAPYGAAPYPAAYAPPVPQLGWNAQAQAWQAPPSAPSPAAERGHAPATTGFGAPPSQDPQVADLRAQVGYLSGQLTAVLDALAKGRDPAHAAAQVAPATPPPSPVGVAGFTADDVARSMLRMAGVTPAASAPAQSVALAAVPKPSDAASAAFGELRSLLGTVKALKTMVRELDDTFAPAIAEDGPDEPEPMLEIPKEEESLPFGVAPIPDVSFLGHPAKYSRDKETGKLSLEGMLLSNPGLAERVVNIVEKLADAAQSFSKKGSGGAVAATDAPATLGAAPAPVAATPAAAVPGDGWPSF